MKTTILTRATLFAASLGMAAAVSAQTAPSAPSPSGAQKGYPTAQAHEAAAARGAPGQLESKPLTQYQINAQKRCDRLPELYKQACLDRVSGNGEATGSVAAGGILRSSEVIIVPAQ
ncbi:hypothetical protein WGP40_06160 [Brachymonas sp. G13]|uniref:hypothetical protein n=1 Tax=Brachymonas TaxID=28219 RepID=UPI001691558F|nr:hypothetical protein [Brachymonas sp. J145]MEE1652852.1 hypothetical protein [Brachymonas sp. J145]NLX15830.1 hypothetical protein [Ramlibacter sp.]